MDVLRTGLPARINGERLAKGPFGAIARPAGPAGRGRHAHRGRGMLLGRDSGRDLARHRGADERVHRPGGHRGRKRAEPGPRWRTAGRSSATWRKNRARCAGWPRWSPGIDPAEIFSAVAGEFGRLLDADNAGISRFESDGPSVVVVGSVGEDAATVPIGTRLELPDSVAPAVVWRTGRSARVDEDLWDRLSDTVADRLRKQGIRPMVGEPDHRREPPVGRGDRVVQARAVSFRRRRPPDGLHGAPRHGGRERPEPDRACQLADADRGRHG